MAYSPPGNDTTDFSLESSYSAPVNDSTDFTISTIGPTTVSAGLTTTTTASDSGLQSITVVDAQTATSLGETLATTSLVTASKSKSYSTLTSAETTLTTTPIQPVSVSASLSTGTTLNTQFEAANKTEVTAGYDTQTTGSLNQTQVLQGSIQFNTDTTTTTDSATTTVSLPTETITNTLTTTSTVAEVVSVSTDALATTTATLTSAVGPTATNTFKTLTTLAETIAVFNPIVRVTERGLELGKITTRILYWNLQAESRTLERTTKGPARQLEIEE